MAKTDPLKTEKAELARLFDHVHSLIPSEYGSSEDKQETGPYADYKKAGAEVDALYRKLLDQVEKHPGLNALRKKRDAMLAKGRKDVKGWLNRMRELKTNLLAGRDLDKVRAELLKIADAVSGE